MEFYVYFITDEIHCVFGQSIIERLIASGRRVYFSPFPAAYFKGM